MKKLIGFILLLLVHNAFSQDLEQTSSSKQSSYSALQPITVTIGGDFIITGSFTSSKNQRLDHFITSVFAKAQDNVMRGLNKPETIKLVSKELEKYALRDITLKRINGDNLKIDLLKFRVTGDFSNNPYLMQDDVIIFPAYDFEKNTIDIDGAVNKPTIFQFVKGDKLSDAIQFAGGLNEAYENVKEVVVSRLDKTGSKEDVIKVKIGDEFYLKPGDRIKVSSDENSKKNYKILVLGQVKNPGYVFITKDNTNIREVIQKAGGFSPNADLRRSELMRGWDESQLLKMKSIREQYERDSTFTTMPLMKKTVEELQSEELKMYRASNITEDQLRLSFNVDNYLRFIERKGIIDFAKIYSDSTADGKFIVKEGDVIIVPEKQDMVFVFGQVVNPGYFPFSKGNNIKQYVAAAGGLTEQAKDLEDASIIKGNNRAWYKPTEIISIEPGDFIYVPKEIPRDFGYYLQQVGSASSILATVVTLVFIIIQSTK